MDSERTSGVLTCTFGWGQVFRLYHDCAYIDGKYYALKDLTGVYPTYRQIIGIPSARLELQFGRKRLILRGIASVDTMRHIVEYLSQWCAVSPITATDRNQDCLGRTSRPTQVLPALDQDQVASQTLSKEEPSGDTTVRRISSLGSQARIIAGPPARSIKSVSNPLELLEDLSLHRAATRPVRVPSLPIEPRISHRLQVPSQSSRTRPLSPDYTQVREENGRKERAEPLRALRKKALPAIPVPIHLLPGEYAYYSANATLCGERMSEPGRSPYPVQDQGMLILTDRRIIYIGRRSQLVLDYRHLIRISRLRRAIAFQSDHWQKRVIFEVARPAECVRSVEKILARRRSIPEGERDDATAPDLPIAASSTTTLRCISAGAPPYRAAMEMADVDTVPLGNSE